MAPRAPAAPPGVPTPAAPPEAPTPRTAPGAPWRAQFLTLYPEMFPGPLGHSLAGRALQEGRWRCDTIAIRAFGEGKHHRVDETPAGGGPGMVLRADVVARAIDAARAALPEAPVLILTPRAPLLTQRRVRELAAGPGVTLVAGRFEGFDERIFAAREVERLSIGDFVLSGGELAAMLVVDACVRLLPEVMGSASSGIEESFEKGLLEYPHYTRPTLFEGLPIPDVLLSGDHRRIDGWRQQRAIEDTKLWRPDLLARGTPDADPGKARAGEKSPSGTKPRPENEGMPLLESRSEE